MKIRLVTFVFVSLLALTSSANAGVYTDDLTRCLIESTSPSDKISLVRWFFSIAALHPSVKSLTSVTETQLNDSNKEISDMFDRLITKSCKDQATKAVKYEGAAALNDSFGVLGKVAGTELYQHPDVRAGAAGLTKYSDLKKIYKALGISQPETKQAK